ncbi:hypothetical protein HY745_12055, partial [Candidatus Desantisbacteria bacterium]|nr:hypothetical protein [Candidatus Desantisbacteria bacterium]
ITSINNGNLAIMYAENTRDDMRKLLDKKFQEQEKLIKEINIARDNVRAVIMRAGEMLKAVASKNPEKFAPITFEESKRLLKEAAKVFNQSVGNTNAKKVNEAMNLALKAENFAKMCDEEIANGVAKYIEENRVKKALEEALKVKDMLEKAKKKKTDKK